MTSDEKRFIQAYGLQGRNQIKTHRANVTSTFNPFLEILMKSHFPDEMFL